MKNVIFTNEESEKVLINQMILDDNIIDEIMLKAPIESFYTQKYKNCYQMILNIYHRKEKVDMISFITECKTRKIVDDDTMELVTTATSSSANWSYYADNVSKCYQSRQLMRVLGEEREKITSDNALEVMARISQEVDNISVLSSDVVEKSQKEVMIELWQDVEKMCLDPKSMKGLDTGLQALNSITGGIQKEYILICARPSMGKTFLAQQMALHFSKVMKVDFIELEMSAKQINFRNLAIITNMRMNDIKYNINKDKVKIARLQKGLEELTIGIGQNYHVVEPLNRKWSSIASYIRKRVKHEGVKVVFIDHVGLIKSDSNFASSWEASREISNGIQKLQRELGIPIIGLSQRSRDSEGGKNKGDLSTIRGSGAYEEDADLIITIEHARATDNEQRNKAGAEAENIECELYVAKNRNGGCGVAECLFRPAYGKFVDKIQNYK